MPYKDPAQRRQYQREWARRRAIKDMTVTEKRRWHRWTEAEDALVADPDPDLCIRDIADRLGLTINVVKNRASYLRKMGRHVPHRRKSGARDGWERRGISLSLYRDENGDKICKDCGFHLPPTGEFWSRHEGYADKLMASCRRCRSDSHHRLTITQRWELLTMQRYRCAFPGCENPLELFGKNTYHIDHNHHCCGRKDTQGTAPVLSCGACIRGLLCRRCNILLRRDVESMLLRATEITAYLKIGDPPLANGSRGVLP